MRQFTIVLLLLVCTGTALRAQINTGRLPVRGGGDARMQRDTTRHEHEPDTLTLRFRYLDEPTDFMLDSSVYDFNLNYLGVPASYMTLGNNGSAARNMIFSPRMQPGFDAGFHAYDIYGFNHQNARFYNTNRPYSELGYLIGSKQEQMINILHTQNRGPKFNFSFAYRKINSPGYYKNQSTNHDNYRFTVNYNSQNKRYHVLVSYYLNKLNGGENGGITDPTLLKDPTYNQLRLIPTNLGGRDPRSGGSSFFNTNIAVKSAYQEASFLWRHQYDWGKGDTIHVNDTTQYYKFDPVFRVEHTFTYTQNTYEFIDRQPDSITYPLYYHFNINTRSPDTVLTHHQWRTLTNDLSLIQFPLRGNMAHFIRLGAGFDNVIGEFLNSSITFQNLRLHGEYRNKTKNQKWDLSAKGEFYTLGENAGDYLVAASLSRYLNDQLGNITIMAMNVNKEPSYVYRYFATNHNAIYKNDNLAKENVSQLQFRADNKRLQYNLVVNYFLFNKYTYFKSYSESDQFTGLFNLLQVILHKQIDIKGFTLQGDAAYQQLAGSAPIQLPNLWIRARLAYNARLFRNLNLFTGVEGKYNTPYYADDYSPMLGQFVYQNQQNITNYPDIAAFVHFRIKSFTAYVRAENLNTFVWDKNFYAPLYPGNNFAFRVGLRWWFIN